MKSKIWIFLTSIFIFISLNAQDINGKWIEFEIPNSLRSKHVNIIEIKNDSLFSYNFNQLEEKTKIKISENTITLLDTINVDYRFSGHNILEVRPYYQNIIDDDPAIFHRLLPTKLGSNVKGDFEGFSYTVQLEKENLSFKLGEKRSIKDLIRIYYPPLVSDMVSINSFAGTSFLCFYQLGIIRYAFPIIELKKSSMIIYGIPYHKGEIILSKVE